MALANLTFILALLLRDYLTGVLCGAVNSSGRSKIGR